MKNLYIPVCLAAFALISTPAFGEGQNGAGSLSQKSKGFIEMDEVLVNGQRNAHQLTLVGNQAVRRGEYDRAIRILTKAVQLNRDDMDAHLHLAEALTQKVESQEEKDPYIFEKAIREWLIVYRGEVGDEKGLTWRGIGFMTDRYADEDRGILAKKELVKLTGHAPKMWETDTKYVTRMLKKDSMSVSGKMVSDKDIDKDEVPAAHSGGTAKPQASVRTGNPQ